MRIFDSDGNGFLDFKEFLLAIDIATCNTEQSRLDWVFKLYDVDNDGVIDVKEMAGIMEAMECLEYKDCNLSAASATAVDSMSALERAQNLFNCIEHANEETLTKEEFIAGYLERNVLMEKQDAHEQRLRLDSLIFRGPLIPQVGQLKEKQLITLMEKLITERCGLKVDSIQHFEQVQLRDVSENYPKNVLVKFSDASIRSKLWALKQTSKKNGLIIEEWLTETRARLYKKCKELKNAKLIKECFTEYGQVYARILSNAGKSTVLKREQGKMTCSLLDNDLLETMLIFSGNTDMETFVINTDNAYDALIKLIKEDSDYFDHDDDD